MSERPDLLPCPFCGKGPSVQEVSLRLRPRIELVMCSHCGTSKRLELWQHRIPPALAWTSEPPKVAGWYWWTVGGRPRFRKVFECELPIHESNIRWSGPIPEPPEPTREEEP